MENTRTRVGVLRHPFGVAGKPEAFSEEENKALRDALRKLRTDRDLSQADVGRLLAIAQQNAGRLLGSSPHTGMSRQTANRLAEVLGYRDAEEFLLEAGVLAAMKEIPPDAPSAARDVAVRVARTLKYDERAITAVLARYTLPQLQKRTMKWWLTKFGEEERELELDHGRGTKPPPAPRASAPVKRKRAHG